MFLDPLTPYDTKTPVDEDKLQSPIHFVGRSEGGGVPKDPGSFGRRKEKISI